MKTYIFIVLILACCIAFGQHSKPSSAPPQYTADTIYWSNDRKLTWNDFKGIPDTSSPGGAGTASGFVTKSRYTSDTSISVVINAVFYKQKSWQKTQYQTVRSLKHEQGHFDITEVYARKATAAFKSYKYDKATVNKDIDSIVNLYFNEMSEIDDLYDKETANHRNFKKQQEWDRKIANWLKKNTI